MRRGSINGPDLGSTWAAERNDGPGGGLGGTRLSCGAPGGFGADGRILRGGRCAGGVLCSRAADRGGAATLGLWLATTTLLSVESRPWIFWQAALGAVFGWAASADRRFRPDPRVVLTIVAVALPIVILLYGKNSLWLAVCGYIPGSAAIRTPARVILVLLVPAALGLAFLVERLDRGRWGAVAWCLALACLAEQTGTTETYDRDASRRRIAEVARQIDRRADSFYYRAVGDDEFFYYVHLNAMWAAIEVGVPTINGISGCFPTGWWNLGWADLPGRQTTEEALQEWCDHHGLRRSDVQRVGRQVDGAIAIRSEPGIVEPPE